MTISRQLIWLALAISLLFNVFFLAGYLQARAQQRDVAREEAAAVDRVAEELELNDAQTTLFRQLHEGMDGDVAVFGLGFALVRQELMDELARPEPDVIRLREIVDREADLHRQRRLAASRRFSEFVGMRSSDQRQRLSEHFRHRRGDRDRDRREGLMRRFDLDGDGHLNEQEQAAAREHFEQRKREHECQRAEMLQRFDANGDGQLDDQELQTARRWFIENGGRRGGGGPPRGRRRD
jgi:hypothetical protein